MHYITGFFCLIISVYGTIAPLVYGARSQHLIHIADIHNVHMVTVDIHNAIVDIHNSHYGYPQFEW
jgi:hypothetical protein